jgi:phosphoglycerate dehydrogenase-like enzyme
VRFVCPDGEPQYRELLGPERLAELAREGHELVWHDGAPNSDDGWRERLADADGALVLWRLPSGVLTACPRVRVVAFAGTGVESYVEMDEARSLGVAVCNVPSYGANAVAEHALALAFAVARGIPAGDRLVRDGGWAQTGGLELAGARLGVVGLGPIGTRLVWLARGLGMDVVAWTRRPSSARAAELGAPLVGLEELFSTSDVVSLHVKHLPETEGLVDARLLALLRPHAILVNTARGPLVDEQALAGALERGAIRGAGLDVLSEEPPPSDHPLLGAPRTVLTPHVGFHTPGASAELIDACVGNLLAFARGEPRNVR